MKQVSFQSTFTPSFVSEALNLPESQTATGVGARDTHFQFSSIVTDSRKIQSGCLFVALKGEKFDGHDFIDSAIAQGAKGILCRRGIQPTHPAGIYLFRVDDTLAAYRKLASAWRKQFSIPVVLVAGAVGKTTTKEFLAAALLGRFSEVLKTQGSQNGFVGIPMTLMQLRPQHGAAVVEVGIDEIGAMDQHTALVSAGTAIVTAIGPEHLEKLRDIPTVAREEGQALINVARTGGTAVVNLDDPWIRPHFKTLRDGNRLGYTLKSDSTSESGAVLKGQLSSDGKTIQVTGFPSSPQTETFSLPLLGVHNASNLLGAITVAASLGLTPDEIRKGLRKFQGAEGRSEIREIAGPIQVICDYYNASPPSMEAGFDLLTQVSQKRSAPSPRWACLGDMLELGPGEEEFHRQLANKLVALNVEHVLLYGPRMLALLDELKKRSFPGIVAHFSTHGELAKALIKELQPGDCVLIKGSRGMKMEEVWKELSKKKK